MGDGKSWGAWPSALFRGSCGQRMIFPAVYTYTYIAKIRTRHAVGNELQNSFYRDGWFFVLYISFFSRIEL